MLLSKRIVDSITPEALFLSLYHGSGILLIRSDEFKGLQKFTLLYINHIIIIILFTGFYDKFINGAQNVSAFCSAFTGEPINYTTVKRGEHFQIWIKFFFLILGISGGLNIYNNRLTLLGSIQPGPLVICLAYKKYRFK